MPDNSVQNRSQARRSISQLRASAVPWGDYKMFLSAQAVLSGVPPGLCAGTSGSENGFFWFLLGILMGTLSFLSTCLLCF